MDKGTLTIAAMKIKKAKREWAEAQTDFNRAVDRLTARVINEAAVNRMGVNEIAHMLGITTKRVRALMRQQGLDPHLSKSLLAQHAAETLAANAELLGIDVRQMDLTSPLAYLPAGKQITDEIQRNAVSSVKEIEFAGVCPNGHGGLDVHLWACRVCSYSVDAQ